MQEPRTRAVRCQYGGTVRKFGKAAHLFFGGEFEVKCVTEVSLKAHGFGMVMPVLQGVVAFNAGMSYKNALASQLAKFGYSGGKYVKTAMDAEKIILMGMEKGLSFVAEKTGTVADGIDFIINKTVLVNDTVTAFAEAGNFSAGVEDFLIAKVDGVLDMVTEEGGALDQAGDKISEFAYMLDDWRLRAESVFTMIDCEAHAESDMNTWGNTTNAATDASLVLGNMAESLQAADVSLDASYDIADMMEDLETRVSDFQRAHDDIADYDHQISSVLNHQHGTPLTDLEARSQTLSHLDAVLLDLANLSAAETPREPHAQDLLEQQLQALRDINVDHVLVALRDLKADVLPRLVAIDRYKVAASSVKSDRTQMHAVVEASHALVLSAE